MREPHERSELIRAVHQHGEAVSAAAARVGVSASTAYRWLRGAALDPVSPMKPTFIEVVPERAEAAALRVRVGVAEIEVRAGFDARLLREVVEALGDEA